MGFLSINLRRLLKENLERKRISNVFLYILPTCMTVLILLYIYKYFILQYPSAEGRIGLIYSLYKPLRSKTSYYRYNGNASFSSFVKSDKFNNTYVRYFDVEALNPWDNRTLLNKTKLHYYTRFKQVMTAVEHRETMDLLGKFQYVCELHNLTYFLYGGSMLGAYRHFGMIPWDDDVDILMDMREKDKIAAVLSNVQGYNSTIKKNYQWKFYIERENNSSNWPYIDIFFFKENSTHIWDNTTRFNSRYCYKKTDVLPLKLYPFESLIMPVPVNLRNVLDVSYNMDLCSSLDYSHKHEREMKKTYTVPCRRLFQVFPFVFETKLTDDIVHRSLKRDDQLIYDAYFS